MPAAGVGASGVSGADMTYRATPITQRDGSTLANSNCRMASIATGLDFDTLGAKKSTGGKMRSFTDDQSGGTDSGDAKQSWSRGYSETLTVRDGGTFDDALNDLRAGRLVHLDVWHASCGGPCLSGSGAYGHTLAVAPERSGTDWLVADPWCSPPKWVWWPESKLRAGAEEWGRRVYGTAQQAEVSATRAPAIPAEQRVRDTVKRLMTEFNPEHPEPPSDALVFENETAGPQRILFTATGTATGGGGETSMAITVRRELGDVATGTPFTEVPGGPVVGTFSSAATIEVLGVPMDDSPDHLNLSKRAVYVKTSAIDLVSSLKIVYVETTALANLRPLPAQPDPVPVPDGEYVAVIQAATTLYVRKGTP